MTEKIEEATRKQVAEFLPRAIEKALGSYYKYLENPPDKNGDAEDCAKKQRETLSFKDYHAAGKVAISHIRLLLNLARWADLPVGNTGMPVKDVSQIMRITGETKATMDLMEPEEEEP